jgi:hypothetical protein
VWTLYPLQVTGAAGTTPAAPTSVKWPLVWGWLEKIYIYMPPGHAGNAGIRLIYQGTQVVPFDPSQYLVLSPDPFPVIWKDQVMPAGFTVQAYSSGKYAHTFYLYAEIDPSAFDAPDNILAPGMGAAPPGYDQSGMSDLSYVQAAYPTPAKVKASKTGKGKRPEVTPGGIKRPRK